MSSFRLPRPTPCSASLPAENSFNTLTLAQVKTLVEQKGADVNELSPDFQLNFLQQCIAEEFTLHEENEFKSIVEYLLEKKVDIDHRAKNGETALYFAIIEDQFDLAELLLKRGADKTIGDNEGKTPYDILHNFNPTVMSESYAQGRQDMLSLLK